MIDLLAGGLPQPFTPLVWVWGARLEMEDEEVWIGDGAALLGPGPELTLSAGGSFSDKSFEDGGTGVGELVLRGDILKAILYQNSTT